VWTARAKYAAVTLPRYVAAVAVAATSVAMTSAVVQEKPVAAVNVVIPTVVITVNAVRVANVVKIRIVLANVTTAVQTASAWMMTLSVVRLIVRLAMKECVKMNVQPLGNIVGMVTV